MNNNIAPMPTQNPWVWVGMGMGMGTQCRALVRSYAIIHFIPTTKGILNVSRHSQVSISFAAKPVADLVDTPHDPSPPFLNDINPI